MTHLVDSVTSIYQSQANEPYVVQSWANTKPGVEALGDQSTMLPTIASQLMAGANSANNAYQAFRGVNLKNRQEINNSTSGLIPFRPTTSTKPTCRIRRASSRPPSTTCSASRSRSPRLRTTSR